MNKIKIFNNSQFGDIRTATTETGEPLFCLSDLCNALNLSNTSVVAKRLDSDEVTKLNLGSLIGETNFVTEPGMYTVILRSSSPLAKPMQKWVTSEVLPSIRKNGAYMTPDTIEKVIADPDFIIALATELKKEQTEKRALAQSLGQKERQLSVAKKQLEYQEPVIIYANQVLSSTSEHTLTTIGAQFNISATILNRLLVKANFLRKTGDEYSLCAAYQGKGLTVTNTFTYVSPKTGRHGTSLDLRYTEAGRMKIYEIIERGKTAGVLKEVKGRLFINEDWKQPVKVA